MGIGRPLHIKPLHGRLVVKLTAADEKTRHGIIIPDMAKEKPKDGTVVAVSEGKRAENGEFLPHLCHVGDRVSFSSYAGSEAKVDGVEYTILDEADVLFIYTGENHDR